MENKNVELKKSSKHARRNTKVKVMYDASVLELVLQLCEVVGLWAIAIALYLMII